MSEYGNDAYMMMTRGSQTSMYAIGFGVRAVLQLAQFIMRLHREGILSGGEVDSFEKFTKATKGEFDIYNLPLSNETLQESQISDIKEKLDVMGIRYHILPDVCEKESTLQICIYKEDLQKFSQFHDAYIRDALSGGEKRADDLRNFTGGRTSIVSLPEESLQQMYAAMQKIKVDYAQLPDLNLKDGEKQLMISNASLTSMKEVYRLYREGMMQQGRSVSDIKVLSTRQYQDTGKMTPQSYLDSADPDIKEKLTKYEGAEVTTREMDLFENENEIRSSKCRACIDFHNNDDYEKLSIDDATLVHDPRDGLPEKLEEEFPDKFFCRIPGTYGAHEQILEVPKSQVFAIEDADRLRYVVFVNKYDMPTVHTADGKQQAIYSNGRSLCENFGKQKEKIYAEGAQPKKTQTEKPKVKQNNFHNYEEQEYDIAAIERALLSRGYAGSTPAVPDVPKAGLTK